MPRCHLLAQEFHSCFFYNIDKPYCHECWRKMQLTPPPFSFSTDLEESQNSSLAMIGGAAAPLCPPPGYATGPDITMIRTNVTTERLFVMNVWSFFMLTACTTKSYSWHCQLKITHDWWQPALRYPFLGRVNSKPHMNSSILASAISPFQFPAGSSQNHT